MRGWLFIRRRHSPAGKLSLIQPGVVACHAQTSIDEPTDDQRINGMFLGLNPRRDFLLAVASEDRHLGLQDNRPTVQLIGDEVHRGAVLLVTVLQHLTMSMQARILRQ